MEDLHTIKTHFAYSLRIDLSHNSVSEDLILLWISKFNCSAYLFGREFKDLSGIPHYQGIVWFESKLSDNDMCKRRNWWRNKTIKTNQGHSFRSARKVTNLGKYCKKDGNLFTNLTSQQVMSLGNWDTKNALKLQNNELLLKTLKNHIPTPVNFNRFCEIFCHDYFSILDRLPSRSTIYTWGYRLHCIKTWQYLDETMPSYQPTSLSEHFDVDYHQQVLPDNEVISLDDIRQYEPQILPF